MENSDKFPFFPRNTKNEVPLNWTPTKMRGKPEYRCNYYQYNFKYGEIRRCSHCCRKQYIINHKDNHVFTIPQEEDDEFDKKVLEKYHNVTYTSFNQRYVKHLGAFCGKVDLSCQKGSSEALRTFSINCIQLGADISSQLRTNSISVNQILNPVSVKTVKKAILNAASDEFEQKVTYFQKYKYLSLLCDAGTVVKLHCLHFILVRYNEQIDKLILETFDVQCGDSFFYMDCFTNAFQKCEDNNLFVCSITFDKLPAQILGFDNFQQTSDNPFFEVVLKIPCFGHMCNNVFLDLIHKSQNFKKFFHEIILTAHLLRTKEAIVFLNARCPTLSTTRWLYLVDILLFMLIHKDDINSFIEIKNETEGTEYTKIDDNFLFVYNLLVLVKSFSLNVEKNDFEFFNIIPLAREFFREIKNLYDMTDDDSYKDIIDIVDISMRIRLIKNAYMQSVAAYVLSNTGRNEVRKHYAGIRNIINPDYLCSEPPLYTLVDERKLFEYKLQNERNDKKEINDKDNDNNYEEEEEEEEFNDPQIEKELELQANDNELNPFDENKDINDLIMKFTNTPLEERLNEDIYINIYENTKSELFRICSLLKIDCEYVENQLDIFLFDDPLELGFMKYSHERTNNFWRKVYSYNENWEIFADLALRYACVFVTETIVERTFSEQSYIQNKRMTNVSSSLMKARLQLHEPSKKYKKI